MGLYLGNKLITPMSIVDLSEYVKKTDYPAYVDGSDVSGVIKVSDNYGFSCNNIGYLLAVTKTLEQYESLYSDSAISKGTLDNVLVQYSKTASLTQAEYDALATKDANTLYLIEEE